MTIPFGTIVLTDFPFADLTASKRRPALVISSDNDRRMDVVEAHAPVPLMIANQDAIGVDSASALSIASLPSCRPNR